MYYVMECYGVEPRTAIMEEPDLPGGAWMTGIRITIDVPNPLIYILDPELPGTPKAMYEGAIPIMRDDLVQTLQKAGVENLELFPAVLHNPGQGEGYYNYKAFNVVGKIACADPNASVLMGTSDSELIDVDFESLVIDESKAGGALMFRLAEAVSAIVVHEKVKKKVEESGIEGMVFLGPEEWSG